METILSSVTKQDIQAQPFPHLVKKRAISQALCDQLIKEFPSMETVAQGTPLESNKRFSYPAAYVAEDESVSQLWRDFIAQHVTKEYWLSLVALFGDHIQAYYPALVERLGPPETWRVGVRTKDTFANADILLDAQICINTPVTDTATSVKIAHVDNERELFASLLYLRPSHDTDSRGGDLNIYKYKDQHYKFHGSRLIEDKYLDKVQTVPYEQNTLVYFMGTDKSLHGVTVREKTPHPRLLVNIIAEMEHKLFDIEGHRHNFLTKLIRRYLLRKEI